MADVSKLRLDDAQEEITEHTQHQSQLYGPLRMMSSGIPAKDITAEFTVAASGKSTGSCFSDTLISKYSFEDRAARQRCLLHTL